MALVFSFFRQSPLSAPCLRTHVVAVRAGDAAGAVQPDEPIVNAGGYAKNSVHRVRVTAV